MIHEENHFAILICDLEVHKRHLLKENNVSFEFHSWVTYYINCYMNLL